MGFGILFIGYLISFVFTMTRLYVFTDLASALLIVYALTKLAPYGKHFKYSLYGAYGLAAVGFMELMSFTISIFELFPDFLVVFDNITGYIKIGVVLAFHFLLFVAIRKIAIETGVSKIRDRSVTSIVVTFFYYALVIIFSLDIPAVSEATKYFSFPVMLIGIIWIIINAALIFSCYMWICAEGDEDMESPAVNIPFLNSINQKLDKFETVTRKNKNKIDDDSDDSKKTRAYKYNHSKNKKKKKH